MNAGSGLKHVQAGESPTVSGTLYKMFDQTKRDEVFYPYAAGKTRMQGGPPRGWGILSIVIQNTVGIAVRDVYGARLFVPGRDYDDPEGIAELLKLGAGQLLCIGISPKLWSDHTKKLIEDKKIQSSKVKSAVSQFDRDYAKECSRTGQACLPVQRQWQLASREFGKYFLRSINPTSGRAEEGSESLYWRL
jgi:hypothetical protein